MKLAHSRAPLPADAADGFRCAFCDVDLIDPVLHREGIYFSQSRVIAECPNREFDWHALVELNLGRLASAVEAAPSFPHDISEELERLVAERAATRTEERVDAELARIRKFMKSHETAGPVDSALDQFGTTAHQGWVIKARISASDSSVTWAMFDETAQSAAESVFELLDTSYAGGSPLAERLRRGVERRLS
jgi:hypothetical protein